MSALVPCDGCDLCEGGVMREPTEATFPDADVLARVEDVRLALERIMDGASTLDAQAFLDHLEDRGRTVQ